MLGAGDEKKSGLAGLPIRLPRYAKLLPVVLIGTVSPDVGKVAVDHPDLITPLKGEEFSAAG